MSADTHDNKPLHGVLAEFTTADDLVRAAELVRRNGYTRWESYSPFPVHGLDAAMGTRATRLPWIALLGGLTGVTSGLLLAWYANATMFPVPTWLQGYRFIISGKPFFSLPANIPVIFEVGVLLSAFGAFFGMLGLNRLPQLHNPLFASERFRRATDDRFFIAIEATDPLFERQRTAGLLLEIGAAAVEELEEETA